MSVYSQMQCNHPKSRGLCAAFLHKMLDTLELGTGLRPQTSSCPARWNSHNPALFGTYARTRTRLVSGGSSHKQGCSTPLVTNRQSAFIFKRVVVPRTPVWGSCVQCSNNQSWSTTGHYSTDATSARHSPITPRLVSGDRYIGAESTYNVSNSGL